MKRPNRTIERSLLVFAAWTAIGTIGLLLIIEGFQRDDYWVAVAGTGCIVATFTAHIVINGVFGMGFSPGESVLGLTTFGFLVLLFVLSVLAGGVSPTDFHIGLTLFTVLIVGFVLYLVTRHGMRGAFSKFHVGAGRDGPAAAREP